MSAYNMHECASFIADYYELMNAELINPRRSNIIKAHCVTIGDSVMIGGPSLYSGRCGTGLMCGKTSSCPYNS